MNLNIIYDYKTNTYRAPRPDACVIVFENCRGLHPTEAAVKNAPECVLRAKTIRGKPGVYIENGLPFMGCDGVYGAPIMCTPAELPELLRWLDKHFDDWRTKRGATWKNCYSAEDYTLDELKRNYEQSKIWATLEPHLNTKE